MFSKIVKYYANLLRNISEIFSHFAPHLVYELGQNWSFSVQKETYQTQTSFKNYVQGPNQQ